MKIAWVEADFLYLHHSVAKSRDDELLIGVIAEVMLHWKLNRELCLRGVAG